MWFPWVLTPIAGYYGLGFTDYDRMGWTRFALTGVHGAWDGTRLEVQRVVSVLPTTWLWQRFNARTNGSPLLTLSGGHLMIGGSKTNAVITASAEPPGSMDETLNQISQIGLTLQRLVVGGRLDELHPPDCFQPRVHPVRTLAGGPAAGGG